MTDYYFYIGAGFGCFLGILLVELTEKFFVKAQAWAQDR